jgi:transketolase
MNNPDLFKRIRRDILTMSTEAGSGHPTSSLSSTELMGTLFFSYLHYDVTDPTRPQNDRVIFSKGHASPLYYALWAAAGELSAEELKTYRQFDSLLEGHPTRRFKFTDAATGSLGQGLAIGMGEALALRKKFGYVTSDQNIEETRVEADGTKETNRIPRVYVLMGDGELAEGSVWEALHLASYWKLNNLIAICDINRLGQSQETSMAHNVELLRKRFESFGWGVILIDGHNVHEIEAAYQKALIYKAGPTAIIAKTTKGKGVSFLEDKDGWHGKALSKEDLEKALKEIGEVDMVRTFPIMKPEPVSNVILNSPAHPNPPTDGEGGFQDPANITDSPERKVYTEPTATRKSFGDALVEYAEHHPSMVVVDGDVMNSTYTEAFAKAYPDRFYECFIAEQTMVGVATGLWVQGFVPWVSTFSAFLSRAYDHIRMAAMTGATIHFNGSHAGVSIGADGGSQMGLEDISMFRALFGSTVVYPADAHASHALMLELMKREGITYLRTTRDATPILYDSEESFPIGGSKTHESTVKGEVTATIISAGITLFEALKVQNELKEKVVNVRVIDCYSIKPLDEEAIVKAAKESSKLIVVEDHYPEGGLGEAVSSVLAKNSLSVPCIHLAVRQKPRSGSKDELLAYEELDAKAIESAIR